MALYLASKDGTPAANMDDQVPEALKSERLARLQYVLNNQHERFNAATVGQTVPVLFERMISTHAQIKWGHWGQLWITALTHCQD